MAEAAEAEKRQPIPIDERVLTEVDHLSQNRLADGPIAPKILDDLLINLTTAVQEGAMPYAVSTVEHEYQVRPETEKGTFMWLGKTAVEAAASGYAFHVHESARKRVPFEIDEAYHAENDLQPGVAKALISPRMSRADASYEIAKQEHLAEDDSVRVSWLVTDKNGKVEKRVLQSLLVRDIPLEAWVAMLQDPHNIFGRAIAIENPESALSVMAVHRELELPINALKNGPVDFVEAVLPYITDKAVAQKVAQHIERYHGDQDDMKRKAENIAERWLTFEVALSESIDTGFANFEIRRFIIGLQEQWGEADLQIIQDHYIADTEYRMTRQLAVVLENAKRNMLWAPAAVVTNNPEVAKQLSLDAWQEIYDNEMLMQIAWASGQKTAALESQNNRLVASHNIKVGGGCPGEIETSFRNNENGGGTGDTKNPWEQDGEEGKDNWKWKQGVCQVKSCPTRPGKTEVGPCSVCRNCQAKFDNGEDPTKTSQQSDAVTTTAEKSRALEAKTQEAHKYEDKELTKELDKLLQEEKRTLIEVY